MPCLLCGKVDPKADKEREYACSICIARLLSFSTEQARWFIDNLYLKDKKPQAEFAEKFFTGAIRKGVLQIVRRKVENKNIKSNILKSRIR